MRIEIFCRVIDNFGDAGFAWRLCRILQAEHGAEVTLWIDDLARLATLVAALDASAAAQRVEGIAIHVWPLDDLACLSLRLFLRNWYLSCLAVDYPLQPSRDLKHSLKRHFGCILTT